MALLLEALVDDSKIMRKTQGEKASLKRYLELEERCTNTRLREVIWE